jgi:hypothetical protein
LRLRHFILVTLFAPTLLFGQIDNSRTNSGQIIGTEFDDFCHGCCGYHLSFYGGDSYSYTTMGNSRFDGFGYWKLSGDTLTLYSRKKRRIEITAKYILSDSLTLKEIVEKGESSQPLHKVSALRGNTKYEYDDKNKLVAIKIFNNGVLVNWRQFNINNTITEKNFSAIGVMQSQGTLTNGKRTGDWKYYDADGIFVETKHLSD